jgi:DNA-binding NarL/FixJ family response regulator
MPAEIRVVIADDHPVFRHGLKQVVEAERDIRVIAAVADGMAALECIRESKPDVAVLDVQMPDLDGIGLAQTLVADQARTRVMFLTMHNEPATFERAMAAGVSGYVLKDAALFEIVQAIRVVASGRTYLSPALSDYVVNRAFPGRRASQRASTALAGLTEREIQILRLIADSQTSKEIAVLLGLNYRTVENVRASMSQKLGLQGSHALVKFAFDHKDEL